MATALTVQQVYDVAREAGFPPRAAATWTAIALAESGGRPDAHNPRGEDSRGLWQINVAAHGSRFGDLYDPLTNARAAFEVSQGGTDMRPWTTTHEANQGTPQDYRTYLDDVERATGVMGDPRGVAGYGAPLPPPLPEVAVPHEATLTQEPVLSYEHISAGAPLGAGSDGDQDGLTDAFERIVGSDPRLADTDRDELSDGIEVGVTRSDPTRADGDEDGLSDAMEVSLGTDPSRLDSDVDGLSDAVEVRYGTDPGLPDAGVGSGRHAVLPSDSPSTGSVAAPSQPRMQLAVSLEVHPRLEMAGSIQPGAIPSPVPTLTSSPGARPPTGPSTADRFVEEAMSQLGDPYVFGAEAEGQGPDPRVFDCSELTQWAAGQVGAELPEGSQFQYLELKREGRTIPVEQALHTRGALLFSFPYEPTGGSRPPGSHVAISLGNGRVVEALPQGGVQENSAGDRFTNAALVPGISDTDVSDAQPAQALPTPDPVVHYDWIDTGAPLDQPPDTDEDGLTDEFERLARTDPTARDTDDDSLPDAFEALVSHSDPLRPDSDRDGRSDSYEVARGTDTGRVPGVAGVSGHGRFAQNVRHGVDDADHDGLSALFEQRAGLDDHLADTDHDGLSDSMEVALGTDGSQLDTDLDGLTDALEVRLGSDPLTAGATAPPAEENATTSTEAGLDDPPD